ncbi:hypothetical protein JIQ42_00919 [Leishmania sp. Namibia]|uniref:hypothetical protein n=1 Tax=Leishmania sp. Namibia TaxID=2802991 RepID=UPI001B68500A|nr:hypothetical protein JIQ42_00919 [Leishmania sp. Namibia]
MSFAGRHCCPTHVVLLLPTPNVGAKSGKYTAPPPPPGQQQQQPATCLSCFVELLRNRMPLPSADVVRRGAVSIMEALVHSCPACTDGEEAVMSWTRDWLTFGCVDGSCSGPAFSGEVSAPRPRPMGCALADVLVALYTYVVRHGGLASGQTSVGVTEATGARTTPGTAAASLRSRGCDSEAARWVVLVDLVQFLFSCWEMLLAGILLPSSQRPTPSNARMTFLNSHEASLQCRLASFDCPEAASLPSPMLLGETDNGVPEEKERQRSFCEGKDEETVQPTESRENVAQVTVEHVQDVVRRIIGEIFHVAGDDAAAIEAGCSIGVLRTPAAATVFLRFVQVSPLLRRLICSSPLLIRSLARYLLPRLVSLQHRQQQQQQRHCQTSGGRKGRSGEATTAIEAVLSILYILSSSAALSMPMWSAQPLSVVASQLSCHCCSSECEIPAASTLADSDGATLLQSLCAVLQSGGGAHPSPLRLQALRLLCLLSSSPTTRRVLFFPVCRRDGAATTYLADQEQRGSTDAAAAPANAPSPQRSSALDVVTHLLPLLLSGEDEEESVQLTCTVLQTILLHVQSACPSAPFPDMHSSTAEATSAAAADVAAAFTEDDLAGTSDSVSGIEVAACLANHIKDYAMQALYSCTCKTGYALVELLDRAASIVAGARALLRGASIEADASVAHDGAVEGWERQQDWRVVFHVATVDMALFEVLLKGTALHNALVQCGVSDDGSETRLCWDEVACSIAAVAAEERGGQLSLFSFLRCLDALAAGMRGNVQALWSSRLHRLVHDLLERVDVNAQGATWRPADAAAAMRVFSTLVIAGVLHGTHNDGSLVATDVPHARDVAATLLLRQVVDPQTLHLLTRVTAAYLPASSDLLPLGVQLLLDFVHTGELVAMSCPASSDYPTMASASLEESRCLLRIATLVARTQLESWATAAHTRQPEEMRARCASGGAGPTDEALPILPYSGAGWPHMPPCTSCSLRSKRYDDDRVGLLDVLLGLYPEAPELLGARTELIEAFARRRGSAVAPPQLLAAHASAFIGAASLTEVAMCASDLQASLLLSLAEFGCPPCVGQKELCAMLVDRCGVLCSRLERAVSSNPTREPAALWSAEAAVEESDAVGPAIAETASDSDDDDAGRLLDALQEVFALLVVHSLWYGVTDSDPTRSWPAPSSEVPVACAVAVRSFSEVHAQALMACVEGSEELRVGLCQYLFDLHTQYCVDVRGFLQLLQGQDDRVPRPRLQQAQAPSHALFAAAVLSVVLYVVDEPEHSTGRTGAASPLLRYMHSLRLVHWLANAPFRQASVPLSVELLLRSVFRAAKRELLCLNHSHHPQEQRASVAPVPSTASLATIGGLQFVYGELAFQQHGLQGGAFPVQRAVAELAPRGDSLLPTPDSAPGATLAICVLREHLVPLLLSTNSNTVAHRNDLSVTVGALEYSTVLLRLMSVALWPLAPATCTSLDAVLAEYAMSHARQLLALTTAELARADGAAQKLIFPLLQLLYLLLTRAHRVDVVRRYGTDLLLFAFRARHAAIARADLIALGEVEQGGLTDGDGDLTHVCVIASIVYITARQIADPRRKRAMGGIGVGSAACVARAASDGTAAAGGGGVVPPPLEGMPWYAWIPVLHHYRRLQTAAERTTSNQATREQRRSMMWIVVSGAEYVIRLCGVSDLACCSHSAAPAWRMETVPQVARSGRNPADGSANPDREEHQAATILIDWCAELVFTSRMSGNDFDGAGLNVIVVAARLLYLLFYRFRALAASSVWFNALVLSCMRQLTPSRRLQLPVVAEGWLLAALMRALPDVQHWCAYDDYVKGSAIRYFEKPEIAARVKLLPQPPPKEPPAHATAGPRTTVPEEVATAGASAAEPELSCVLRILVTACRQYERSPHRLRSRRRLEVIVPLSLQLSEEAPLCACPSVLEYAFPYTVPLASAGAPPLLLVFRCFADRIRE